MTSPETIVVEVVYARPDHQDLVTVTLPAGGTVADALARVADRGPFSDLDLAGMPVGVFGDRVERSRQLVAGDRVELYRPLVIDPREARRRRASGSNC